MKLNMKAAVMTIGAVICLLAASRIISIIREGEEGRLRRTIYKAKRLIERENIIALTDCISASYDDELANDRHSLLFIAKSFFREYKNILISIDSLEIDIDGDDAIADIEATVYWQENDSADIIYDNARVDALYRKEEKNWKLIELKIYEVEQKKFFRPHLG